MPSESARSMSATSRFLVGRGGLALLGAAFFGFAGSASGEITVQHRPSELLGIFLLRWLA